MSIKISSKKLNHKMEWLKMGIQILFSEFKTDVLNKNESSSINENEAADNIIKSQSTYKNLQPHMKKRQEMHRIKLEKNS
jgi:hypothetical protein